MQLITQHHHHHHHHHHHQQQQHDTKSTIPNIPPYFNTNCTVLDIKYTTRYQTKQVIYKMHHLKYQTHHPNPKYSIPNRKITILNSEHLIPITKWTAQNFIYIWCPQREIRKICRGFSIYILAAGYLKDFVMCHWSNQSRPVSLHLFDLSQAAIIWSHRNANILLSSVVAYFVLQVEFLFQVSKYDLQSPWNWIWRCQRSFALLQELRNMLTIASNGYDNDFDDHDEDFAVTIS